MFEITKNKIIMEREGKKVKIPSQLYPVNGKLEVFYPNNTIDCNDKRILEIYDSVKSEVGKCYTNTERLYNAFQREGIETTTYVGWVFSGEDLPVHHAFLVYDNKYLFDFIADIKMKDLSIFNAKTKEEARIQLVDFITSRKDLKNSERFTKGQVDPFYLYVGSKCSPQKGREIFNKLIKAFPKHPSYEQIGLSKTQEMLYMK